MSKKTVLSMLFLAAVAAMVFPVLSCKDEEPQFKIEYLFNEGDTAFVPMHGYWSKAYVVTSSMLSVDPRRATLSATLACCFPTSPNNKLSWYILDSANYASYQAGNTNPTSMCDQTDIDRCTLFTDATSPGTYWLVVDNRADTLSKRIYGWVSRSWYVKP
jgi:hypothetical protein